MYESSKAITILRTMLILSSIWLVGCAAFLVSTILTHQPSKTSEPLVYNMIDSDVSTGEVRYYNGNSFVKYDKLTHKIIPLAQFRRLTNILDVFWLKDGAIISASYINPGSDLSQKYNELVAHYATIPGAELTDPTQVYWYVSFKDNTVSVLKIGRVNTTLFGSQTRDGGYIYADTDDYSYISPTGEIQKHVLSVENPDSTRIVWCDDDTIVYLTQSDTDGVTVHSYDRKKQAETSTVKKLDSDGKLTIYNSFVASSASMIYFTDTTNLGYVNPQNNQTGIIEKNVNGALSEMNDTIYGLNIGVANISLVKVQGVKTVSRLEMNAPFSRPSSVFGLSDAVFGYSDLNGHLIATAKDAANISSFKPGYSSPLEKKIPSLQRNIMSPYDNAYTYSIVDGSIGSAYDDIWKQIEQQGLNPYEFTIEVNGGSRATD